MTWRVALSNDGAAAKSWSGPHRRKQNQGFPREKKIAQKQHAVDARVRKTEKYAGLTLLASDVPKTMVFVGCLTHLTLFWGKNKICFSPNTMSDMSDIPQKPMSWARLTQAMSDMHIFRLSKHEHRQHAEGICGGMMIAGARNHTKPDLCLLLLLLRSAPRLVSFVVFFKNRKRRLP